MKATGMVRRVDELGRIVIPKEIRKTLKIKEGEPLEIFVDKSELILKKYSKISKNSELSDNIVLTLTDITGGFAIITDSDEVVSASSKLKHLIGEKISPTASDIILNKKSFAISVGDNINLYPLTSGDEKGFLSQVILPILSKDGQGIGLIALYGVEKANQVDSNIISLLRLASSLLSKE